MRPAAHALALNDPRPIVRLVTLAMLLAAALLAVVAPAHARGWGRDPEVHLAIAGGTLDVALAPDGASPLRLTPDGPHRFTLTGSTAPLVGHAYSVRLRNRSGERLKVVVGVDGLNVYAKETVVGSADGDVGSILDPWSERTLTGWQLDDERAQRFVFSPPEWSEGQGITDSRIGLLTVQAYRERREIESRPWLDRRDGAAPSDSEAPMGSSRESAAGAPAEPPAATLKAQADSNVAAPAPAGRAPIGTTAGDEVASAVRTVFFEAATRYPEAWTVIDYGTTRLARVHPPVVDEERLGMTLEPARDGARIVTVEPGGAAARAGLAPSDVIVRLDTTFAPSVEQARDILRRKASGDFAFLRVRRGGNELAVKLRT